jgi:replicative DNA helicase
VDQTVGSLSRDGDLCPIRRRSHKPVILSPVSERNGKWNQPGITAGEMGKLFDRLPPHALEAEMSLLGSMILDPQMIPDVLPIVSRRDQFYKESHGAIFEAIVEVYDKHHSGDLVQIVEYLKGKDQLDLVGGPTAVVEMAESVPSAINAPHYARIVSDRARLRKLIDAAGTILYDAYHAGQESEGSKEVIDKAEMAIFDIAQEEQVGEPEKLKELLQQQIELIEQAEGKGISGVATGFDELDKMLSGLQGGEMLILAARPSMGKTACALNLAEQVAFGGITPWSPPGNASPVPVGFFSLEMARGSLAQRLLSARSGIDAHKLRTGALTPDDWQKVTAACAELYEAPIFIDDTPGMTILNLRARARRMVAKHGVRVIFIDYLQLLTAPGAARESRQVEVSTISRQIKALARELSIPIVTLAQLNRGAEQRERNRPRMSDLRESGSIEQDADVVMLLHREAYYHKDDEEWLNDPDNEDKISLSEIIIAKQRNGPTGTVKLTWDDKTTRFKNYDWRHSSAYGGGYNDYASPSQAAETKPASPHAFSPGSHAGPAGDFRDGGGPDDDFDEEPPF